MNCLRIITLLATILVAGGCTTYIEKPTPIAAIPPPPQIQPPLSQEIPRTAPGDPLSGSGLYNGPMALDKNMTRDGAASGAGASSGTIMRFRDAYVQAKRPRIAIFMNRTLSDDVREWNTVLRAAVSGDGSVSRSRETLGGRTEETVSGNVAVAGQTALNSAATGGGRVSPGENYLWPFEDGFMQQFLKGGAVLVDRAAILRLTARETSQKFDAIEAKKIEMNALLNYADIFVELLITRSPSAPSGYEFRATAKEVQTGRILANATSLNWDAEQARPKKVIATSAGYEIIDDSSFPKVQVLSRDLALDLMNMLIPAWGGR